MKWFQHYSDSYTNLKLQELISEFGIEGYGVFWICCELVAQQGINYKIENGKNWKKALAYIVKLPLAKLDDILNKISDISLIDKEAYLKNALSIPKMAEYSDDYSKRVRRVSELTPNNVRQDKIRLDKNTISTPQASPSEEISYSLDEDLQSTKALKRKELVKAKGYDPALTGELLKWGEAKMGRRYPNPKKQLTSISAMLASGFSPDEIKAKWGELEDTDYWQEKGIDFGTVLSQISKKKAAFKNKLYSGWAD